MKKFIKQHTQPLISGAVCLLLALALAAGCRAALLGGRSQPDTPAAQDYPGLNIQQVGLRYDQDSSQTDGAAGDSDGDGASDQNAPTQDEPLQEQPQPEQIPVEQPDTDTGEPDETTGDDETEDGDLEGETPAEEETGPKIATDLRNQTISQEQLPDGLYRFMAQIVGGDEDTYLRVRLKNSQTNGRWLSAADGDYAAQLALGQNEITVLMKRGAEVIGEITYVIRYQAAMATEEEPEKGTNPPIIYTNLDSDVINTSNRNLTLKVRATDGAHNTLYQNHIQVKLDGQVISRYTGSGDSGLEYQLPLAAGSVGDQTEHTLTILAWDDAGNSTLKTYKIIYGHQDTGEKIGTATIRLDLSVLGLGIIDAPVSCDIFQDVPASYAVKAALEENGYTFSYDGTLDNGFYLTRITRALTFKYAAIPEELQQLLELDGLAVSRPSGYKNSVGEYDYTTASGWMYSINGAYPGKGLSEYYLSDGDTLTIRFTLAYGKDIGGGSNAHGGALRTYCGQWIDGSYIANHTYENGVCTVCGAADPDSHTHQETESVTRAATCTEAGEKTITCTLCGQSRTETIPATGHSWSTTCQPGEGGYAVTVTCTVCGAGHSQTVSTDSVEEVGRIPPTCTATGSVTHRVTVTIDGQSVSTETTTTLDKLPHTYDETGICSGCGQSDPAHTGQEQELHDENTETP